MRGFAVQPEELEARTRIILRSKGDVSGAHYAGAVEMDSWLGPAVGDVHAGIRPDP